jgi:EAL domain-containing protein (putative c-di-GMP-specific phosphodiesterase class I)
MLMFALILGVGLYQRMQAQAYSDGIESAQAEVDVVYALLRGRFEHQLLSSQGNQERYQSVMPIVQEESILLLKNLITSWSGSLLIQDTLSNKSWLWDGHNWRDVQPAAYVLNDEWVVNKSFLPWSWHIQVRPDVETISAKLSHDRSLFLGINAILWLLSALLIWWRLHRLVLRPVGAVVGFLARVRPGHREHISINGSKDMRLLAKQLNDLSERLYEQHVQIQSQIQLLADDRAYIRAVLDAQPAMTVLTNGVEMIDANDSLFRFLPQFQSLEAFKQAHDCICDLFLPYQDPLGYSYFAPNHTGWVGLALEQDYRVLMTKDERNHHFMVRTRRFLYQEQTYFVAVFDDITEHVASELAMQHQQLVTDVITGLPNRVKLLKDTENFSPQGILLVKILEFGRLNEVYGIKFGDAYLRSFADRLRSECHQLPGLIGPYRLSGSEFAYQLFDDEADTVLWQTRAKWLINDLNSYDLEVWGAQIPVMVVGGLSLWDEEVDDEEQLLLQAAMAMNKARQLHVPVLEYDIAWRERQKYQQAQEWLEKVRDALNEDRIEPVFQPIYNQAVGIIDKYECLLRLRDHQDQLIAPGFFLNAVRHTREYLRLTQVMFEKSCALFSRRNEQFTLNLSEDDFRHTDHLQRLYDIVLRNDVGHRLTLEVVESEEITSYEQMLKALAPFRALGCRVAIDDFGSGYANFVHITGLEAELLKIDGSLIQAMVHDPSREGVVRGLVEFGHRMGLKVVAEFVSSDDLWRRVARMGVDGVQGYAVSAPVRAALLGTVAPQAPL